MKYKDEIKNENKKYIYLISMPYRHHHGESKN